MTDTSTQTEQAGVCRSCGSFYAVRFQDAHKRVCPAVTRNTFGQWREQHGGQHVALEEHLQKIDGTLTEHNETVTRIDKDFDTVFHRLDDLENAAPTNSGTSPAGITVGGYLDNDNPDDEPDPPATTQLAGPYQPL